MNGASPRRGRGAVPEVFQKQQSLFQETQFTFIRRWCILCPANLAEGADGPRGAEFSHSHNGDKMMKIVKNALNRANFGGGGGDIKVNCDSIWHVLNAIKINIQKIL